MTEDLSAYLVGHRGYPARFAENSLAGLRAVVAAGARYVEFDVQMTRDGIPVLSHDAELKLPAQVGANLLDLTLIQLAEINREPVPTLRQVVAWLSDTPQVTAFVELKVESLARFGIDNVLNAVLEIIAPVARRCVVISFDFAMVRQLGKTAGIPVGWVLPAYDDVNRQLAEQLAPDFLICNHCKLPAGPAPLWSGRWQWIVYEVGTRDLAVALLARGVSLIETDNAGFLLQGQG